MNKLEVIERIIRLSKRTDYILRSDWCSYCEYRYDSDTTEYTTVKYGTFVDTGGGWLRYNTKDVSKYYLLNPIERLLVINLFK